MNDRIAYKRNFYIGDHLHEHIGYETDLLEGESIEDGYNRAMNVVIGQHKANNPHLYLNGSEALIANFGQNLSKESSQKVNPGDPIDVQIRSCTDLKVLESYKLIVAKNPELKSAYDETYLKLSK